MVNVAVDARSVFAPNRRGIGKTLLSLYRQVAAMKPEWRFVMFHRGQGKDAPFAGLPNVQNRVIEMKGDRFNLWEHIRLPLAAKLGRADMLHCPANTSPCWPMVPMVLTIHDLIPLEPEFRAFGWRKWGRNVAKAAKKARRIITPSEYTKQQIVRSFGVPTGKVVVNHWAADENCRRVTDPAEFACVRSKYGLDASKPYVFGFAAISPRKNTLRIISAWSGLPREIRNANQMLLVGAEASGLPKLRQHAEQLGVSNSCIVTGFAAEKDVPPLVSGAMALCYPSLSEGFGLPILDAFACETPVLTSNRTSLPEVAGDAAVLVDPSDTDAIREGIRELLSDDNKRRFLIEEGKRRLKLFSWPECAKRTCRVFEEAIG